MKAQNVYIATLSSALTAYINKKVKIEPGKDYDLTNIDIGGFITAFDELISVIRSDEAEEEQTEYQHNQFEGMPIDRVASEAWNRISPKFNKPLHELWAGQVRKGGISLERLRSITDPAIGRLDPMTGEGNTYDDKGSKDLAEVITIRNTMQTAISKRSRISYLNPFNWLPYSRETSYLNELNDKINTYIQNGFPVSDVVPKVYEGNMLEGARSILTSYIVDYKKENPTSAQTAVNRDKLASEVNNKKNPEKKKPVEPAIKLSNAKEALEHHGDPKVQEKVIAEISKLFTKSQNSYAKYWVSEIVNNLDSQIKASWSNFENQTADEQEKSVKDTAISTFKQTVALKMDSALYKMDPAERIVALQKATDILLKNFYPATSDSKYYQYFDNYFVKTASLEDVQEIVGKDQDVAAIMESACKELGVEKSKVYLPTLSEKNTNVDKSDVIKDKDALTTNKELNI